MTGWRAVAAGVAVAVFAAPAIAQTDTLQPLRIGVVIPSRTGEIAVRSSVNDYTGEAALMGARSAESELADEAEAGGMSLDLLLANSPTAEAAERAARRLVELEKVSALIGGIGEGQAEVLRDVAEDAGVPFLNIGATADALRGSDCSRYMFHIEASDAMYLDAMAALAVAEGITRWFVVYESGAEGAELMARAEEALAKFAEDGEVVGSAMVPPQKPSYADEIHGAARLDADAILLLLDPFDQMVFIGQQDSMGSDVPTLTLPHTLTQTRDYIAAARYTAPQTNPRRRVALWETTLETNGADAFNETFRSRWGEPTDPTAWAAFQAVKILTDAAASTGSSEGEDLVEFLHGSEAEFDLLKGPGTSFRAWNHQLRQPLYDVIVDQDVEWKRTSLPSRIAIAGIAGQIPEPTDGANPVEELDRLGDTAEQSACRF